MNTLEKAIQAATTAPGVESDSQTLAKALSDADVSWSTLLDWLRSNLVPEVDYGIVPGSDRPSLLQPGAEKIAGRLGWRKETPDSERWVEASMTGIDVPEITQRVYLFNAAGQKVGEGMGAFPVTVKRFNRKTGEEFDVRDLNKAIQMSMKRAFVAAVKSTAGLSAIFTMDMSNMADDGSVIEDHPTELEYIHNKAAELYGDLAEATLERLAKQRFGVESIGQVPKHKMRLVVSQLVSHAPSSASE